MSKLINDVASEYETTCINIIKADLTTHIKVKKLNDKAILPTHGSVGAAGWDLYACLDKEVLIQPHQTVKIPTGLAFELPNETFMAIHARSGLATKEDLAPANKVGVCDSDYTGEYIVALHNHGEETRKVKPCERIAQMILQPYIPISLDEVDELSDTERGAGGFGSTGKN